MAAAVVAGNTVTEIAQEEGVSRQHASQEVHAPETQHYILHLMEQHYAHVEKCFARALTCIEEALDARRIQILKDGTQIDAGPDHYARLAAAKRLLEYLLAGRPVPQAKPEEETKRKPTWEDFMAMMDEHENRKVA